MMRTLASYVSAFHDAALVVFAFVCSSLFIIGVFS